MEKIIDAIAEYAVCMWLPKMAPKMIRGFDYEDTGKLRGRALGLS